MALQYCMRPLIVRAHEVTKLWTFTWTFIQPFSNLIAESQSYGFEILRGLTIKRLMRYWRVHITGGAASNNMGKSVTRVHMELTIWYKYRIAKQIKEYISRYMSCVIYRTVIPVRYKLWFWRAVVINVSFRRLWCVNMHIHQVSVITQKLQDQSGLFIWQLSMYGK